MNDYVEFSVDFQILVNTPPEAVCEDITVPLDEAGAATILANQVDGVVLVIHGGKTPRDAVEKATRRVLGVGGNILGGMVNNIDMRRSEYSYYYRYSYDYQQYGDTPNQGVAG